MDLQKLHLAPTTRPYPRPTIHHLRIVLASGLLFLLFLVSYYTTPVASISYRTAVRPSPHRASAVLARCRQLNAQAGPPQDFHQRRQSDRFEEGTSPVLIQNATIWTGADNGTEVVKGDILLDKGLIKGIGHLARAAALQTYGDDLVVVDAKGAWVTPGIVDVHSHMGGSPSPALSGAEDDNSFKGNIQPWLRSLDALNTHDDSYPLSIAGGVTTSLVLPGSADAIGGQAFVIKLRATAERSSSSMLLEPPHHINASFPDPNLPPRWRHIKHACGAHPYVVDKKCAVYDGTRMDTFWDFRQAYNTAKQIKERQDAYCAQALSNDWENLDDFPEDLQWEALVDVLRGRVKVNTHCYEAVDLDAFVRLSNEFQFPVAAFHHASEAYLVPDLLKQAYGNIFITGKPPAIALFAIYARYKREAYRASEFAPRVLAEHGLTVLMKSDHPAVNSRYLLHEAQQAYFYGFPENLAIASVTSNSADVLGMGHRIGYVTKGYDADLVIWDSHPLALGATPVQVFIDGIPQLDSPSVVSKPDNFQQSPKVPNFDDEAKKAVDYDGLPPLLPKKLPFDTTVMFMNVKAIQGIHNGTIQQKYLAREEAKLATVVTHNGSIVCYGTLEKCSKFANLQDPDVSVIDLEGGSILPGLVSFGCPLGLEHINQEPSTNDGSVYDPLYDSIPDNIGGDSSIIRAVDGLQYGTRHALLAYRSGVTVAVTAPIHDGFFSGLGTSFSLGASHKLEDGAIVQEVTAVHVSVRHLSGPSISTQIAVLRRQLRGPFKGETGLWFKKVRLGQIPLVVEAHSADVIATLLVLKKEIETESGRNMRFTITGGAEAYLLARQLSEANVGVILSPARPFPHVWEGRRILPGPPISNNSTVMELISNNVAVGLGCEGMWSSSARNLPFNIAWAAIESGGRLSKEEAIAMGSTNVLKLLGVNMDDTKVDLVATRGGDLGFESKVIAIISARQKTVHMF
ncbi:carbohydrate esterase family 9 protein [Flammula alnicola]|nr:carbohydrate esterase family 9 protein [Flammula alnicola]